MGTSAGALSAITRRLRSGTTAAAVNRSIVSVTLYLKRKPNSLKLNDFYASRNEIACPNFLDKTQKMLAWFGSVYVCE